MMMSRRRPVILKGRVGLSLLAAEDSLLNGNRRILVGTGYRFL
jgi:hypothetical protein